MVSEVRRRRRRRSPNPAVPSASSRRLDGSGTGVPPETCHVPNTAPLPPLVSPTMILPEAPPEGSDAPVNGGGNNTFPSNCRRLHTMHLTAPAKPGVPTKRRAFSFACSQCLTECRLVLVPPRRHIPLKRPTQQVGIDETNFPQAGISHRNRRCCVSPG